jgi:N-methylhydantoinase B
VSTFQCRGTDLWYLNAVVDRVQNAARGLEGGLPGATGYIGIGDDAIPAKQQMRISPDSTVDVHLPGGGGFGDPSKRDINDVLADVAGGYVSPEAAHQIYGVEVRYTGPADALVRPPWAYSLVEGEATS